MESRIIALSTKIDGLQRLCAWAMFDLDYFTFQENTELWRLSAALRSSECLSVLSAA